MTHSFSGVERTLAAALLALAACAERAPIADVAAPPLGSGIDSIDLGALPSAVVVADFNGDGRPDLAATALGANGLVVALGRREGFAPSRAYPVEAEHVVAGDFDGDGKLDLVVTNAAVGVLLGKGDGTFGAMRSFDAGGPTDTIVAGDFNRDGKLDVAVMKAESVGVLLGNGDGSFQPPKSYAVPPPPHTENERAQLVAGDVDGDGTLDLVTTYTRGPITSLLGNGDGTFRSGATLPSDYGRIQAVAGADFNGDGKLDLAVAFKSSDPGKPVSASIWLGNGDGHFHWSGNTGLIDHASRDDSRQSVAVADLDGDGKLDLVAYAPRSHILVAARGKGDGTLDEPSFYRISGTLIAAADIDGDGKAEVLTTGGGGLAVIASNGDGTLRAPRSFRLGEDEGGITGRIAVGDFNRDGLVDVAVTYNNTTAASVMVLLADGHGGLRYGWGRGWWAADERADIAAVDLDGDGVLDLVDAGGLWVMLGNGDGTFREAYRDDLVGANSLVLGDFDGDGKLDAALYRSGQRGLTIMPGKGDGTFAKEQQIAVPVNGVVDAVAVADLDGDGHTDLAVSAGGSLLVLLGKGDGSFAPARPVAGVPSAASLAAADLDSDRRIDLVVAHAGELVTTVLLNAGGGAFRRAGTVPSSGRLRVADLGGDGVPDLLVLGDALAIYRGRGDGTFETARYRFGGSDFGVADINGDGRPEIVVAAGNKSPFLSVLPAASR